MNSQLRRVQVYLEPQDVMTLDQLAERIDVTRSQLIRDATKAVALRYAYVANFLPRGTKKRVSPLRELAGVARSKTGKVGLNVNEIYEQD